ncbi:hypothetical protein ABID26_004546 [Mesorhizobium shonense]|uniref:Uncharacterized protein n=1 Tax=Mesorhizobium shonense TaxID=1209948 RepID=A0ABV2HXM7_9HYPH
MLLFRKIRALRKERIRIITEHLYKVARFGFSNAGARKPQRDLSGFVWISRASPIGPAQHAAHSHEMMAEYVELVLVEQSLSSMNWPFFDRVGDVVEKTDGCVLFDIRVEGDTRMLRMAAIGYSANGTVAIMMDKNGRLSSTPSMETTTLSLPNLARGIRFRWPNKFALATTARPHNCLRSFSKLTSAGAARVHCTAHRET